MLGREAEGGRWGRREKARGTHELLDKRYKALEVLLDGQVEGICVFDVHGYCGVSHASVGVGAWVLPSSGGRKGEEGEEAQGVTHLVISRQPAQYSTDHPPSPCQDRQASRPARRRRPASLLSLVDARRDVVGRAGSTALSTPLDRRGGRETYGILHLPTPHVVELVVRMPRREGGEGGERVEHGC